MAAGTLSQAAISRVPPHSLRSTKSLSSRQPCEMTKGFQPVMMLGAGVQEAGAFWRAEPLVKVAGVAIRADGFQVKGQLPGRVRPVNDGQDALPPRAGAYLRDREYQRRWRGDVAEDDGARARRDFGKKRLDEVVVADIGQRHLMADNARAALGGFVVQQAVNCAVFVVAGQDFVARRQRQGAHSQIHAGSGRW